MGSRFDFFLLLLFSSLFSHFFSVLLPLLLRLTNRAWELYRQLLHFQRGLPTCAKDLTGKSNVIGNSEIFQRDLGLSVGRNRPLIQDKIPFTENR